MDEKINTYLSASPIMNVEWAVSIKKFLKIKFNVSGFPLQRVNYHKF